jgi:hypothetical protein
MLLMVFLRYVFASFCLISSLRVLVGLMAMIAVCRLPLSLVLMFLSLLADALSTCPGFQTLKAACL